MTSPARAVPFVEYQSTFPERWNDAWSDASTGFRISLGSVSSTEMYMLYDVKLQKDLFAWWQIRYQWRFLSNRYERTLRDARTDSNSDYGLLEARFLVWRWIRALALVYPTYSKLYTSDLGFGFSLDPSWTAGHLEFRAGYLKAYVTNYTQRVYDRVDSAGQPSFQQRWEIEPFHWELSLTARLNRWIALDWINVYRHERYRTLNTETDPPTLWALADSAVNRYRAQLRVEHPDWPVVRFEITGRGRLEEATGIPIPAGLTYREVSADYAFTHARVFARGYSGFRRYRPIDLDSDLYDEKGWQAWLSVPLFAGIWGGARYEHRDTSVYVWEAHRHQFGVTGERRFDGVTLPSNRTPFSGWTFHGPGEVLAPPSSVELPPIDVFVTFTFIADEPGKTTWETWDRLFSINFQTRF